MDRRDYAELALAAARRATAVHRRHAGGVDVSEWAEKGTADFVTRVDREAEAAAIACIRERCPGHEFMAEESAELGEAEAVIAAMEAADHLWVLDPLDGTTNYLHGYPAYAASVALFERGELLAGAVVDGVTGTEWWASRGAGAWRDGHPVRVSTIDRLDRALVGTGFPFKVPHLLPGYLAQLGATLRATSGVRRAGAAALDLCMLADGRLDGFWELWLAPWDIAAGTLIVREAGGLVTGLDGAADVRAGGAVLAGNPAIHERLRGLLAEATAHENPRPGVV